MENIKNPEISMDRRDILRQGMESKRIKTDYMKANRSALKDLSSRTHISSKTINTAQRLLSTKGAGWGDSCLEFNKHAKERDSISKAFIKLRDVITTLVQVGEAKSLHPYLDEMRDCCIDININKLISIDAPDIECADDISTTLNNAAVYVKKTNDETDKMKDLAEAAEESNLCPKAKFPVLVNLATKKSDGIDIQENISDEQFKIALFESGLETLEEM